MVTNKKRRQSSVTRASRYLPGGAHRFAPTWGCELVAPTLGYESAVGATRWVALCLLAALLWVAPQSSRAQYSEKEEDVRPAQMTAEDFSIEKERTESVAIRKLALDA